MPLTNAVWTEEANADDRSKWMPMHNNRRAIAIGCALASFIVLDGFSMLCAAQPATAKVNERLQFLEWCESNGRDIWYDLVIRGCSEVIRVGKETPKDLAFAFTNRGNGYAFKQDYDRAIADYTEAIKLDPDFAAAYNGRAGAYSDQGDVDRAVADYIDARRLALRNAGDRTVSVLQRDHTPAIAAVNPQSPIPAATAPGSENRTTVDGTNAMSKSKPILQSSLRARCAGYGARRRTRKAALCGGRYAGAANIQSCRQCRRSPYRRGRPAGFPLRRIQCPVSDAPRTPKAIRGTASNCAQ
jgi:tetratricopeptide (TPR) repeat protein